MKPQSDAAPEPTELAQRAVQNVIELAAESAANRDWSNAIALAENVLAIDSENETARRLRALAGENGALTDRDRPETFAAISCQRDFSATQLERIRAGYQARSMEEKWDIEFREPWLCFHRSWTGLLIYRLLIERTPSGASVAEAWGYRDGSRSSEMFDSKALDRLVDSFLSD